VRILLVEDEPNAARMLAKGLREESYAVDVAADGESALEQAHVNDYDLIILASIVPSLGTPTNISLSTFAAPAQVSCGSDWSGKSAPPYIK